MEIKTYSSKFKKEIISHIGDILEKEFNQKLSKEIENDLSDIKRNYKKDGGNFWISLDNDKLTGTIGLKNIKKKRGYLRRLYVKKKYRGTGLAFKLLKKVINLARKNQMRNIYLNTGKKNIAANKFYLKNNFKRIKKMPLELLIKKGIFYKLSLE